ncbi:asparagine synthase (glutamine-hydrolyzing) [Alkaliphilus hydrothermalis]|uniref:asparagine synthase (glutamine-hydrolyzing) n=1 Tax=Alkaliphilus hydrothermalis TaxID=1482730 RepID=A0ABS2NRP1_9FIRM|nr:asparagine synthase (glutamine-hydrolyzing) [Alkaliphilus hydrothermalis]MBM7615635.1 asparagine synthase (glutamine-hydrolyzing) [Alkaliphilus hydrothermalis]
MCGIVGWVNLKEDLSEKRKIMEEMTNTLVNRGPDAFGLYNSANALFGHRRLIVVDPEGGGQPMTRMIEDREYTMVYNGELYNTEEVRKKLLDLGYQFMSYSDTEVLLVSYIAWGPDCVDHLNGIYAFGIWDEEERRLFMARDRLGVKPLFYTNKGHNFMFASELKALLAHPMVEPIIDETGIMELFGLGPARPLGSGVFKDVKEIPPAHRLIWDENGCKIQQYWQLESRPHEEDLQTTIAHTRELLVDAIERQLVSDVPVCTFLSGGLDSSAISAIASNAFKRDGKGQLHTYSIDYRDNDIYFKPSEFQPNSDKMWIKKMTEFLGSQHHDIIIDTPQLVDALEDAVKARDLPGMADVDSSLYLFCKEVRENATVALSGECADEIFGGYPWFRRPQDIHANTFPWSKSVKERKMMLGSSYNHLPLEEYVASQYEDTLKQVPALSGESKEVHRMREISYLNLKWFMITLLNRKDRMSMANGLEVRVPFADHRIVEYAWNIPIEMKYTGDREKGLLRQALAGILPQEVIDRKKSPYPKTHNPGYLKAVQRKMKMILQDPTSPILQIVDKHRMWDIVNSGGASFDKPWFGQLMTGPQLIAYSIQMNQWMKAYNVRFK